MDLLQVPPEFLQLSIKYEYFKRNSAMQAHLNVCELIDLWPSRRPYLDFPVVEPEFERIPDEPRPVVPLRRPRLEPMVPTRSSFSVNFDSDSDDANTNYPEEQGGDERNDQCTLTRAKWMYEKLAEKELEEYQKKGKLLEEKDILEILSIRRIAKAPISKLIRRPIKKLKVTVGYRKINMTIESQNSASLLFMSSREGCLVWYGETMKVETTMKYQSLAAKDFYYLVKDHKAKLEHLMLYVEEYKKHNPPIWPFESFYKKINNYWRFWVRKLHVKYFRMDVFHNKNNIQNGQLLLWTFWHVLDPGLIQLVSLRIWDDSEVCKKRKVKNRDDREFLAFFYQKPRPRARLVYPLNHFKPLWCGIAWLDIMDNRIVTRQRSYEYFMHFRIVRLILTYADYRHLLQIFESRRQENVAIDHVCEFFVQNNFKFPEALNILKNRLDKIPTRLPNNNQVIVETETLANGTKITLNEETRSIIFKRPRFIVPKVPKKIPASKL